MPVSNKHPAWEEREYSWYLVRTAMKGQSAIKRNNTLFLPMPTAMMLLDTNPAALSRRNEIYDTYQQSPFLETRSPNYHPNLAYASYKARAQFPEITSSMGRGLVGIAIKKDPIVELPNEMLYMLDESATASGENLLEFFKYVVGELLQTGRMPISLDIDPVNNRPYIVSYIAESLINWRAGYVDGNTVFQWAVFEEQVYDIDDNIENDIFSNETESQWRLLSLINNKFTLSVYDDENDIEEQTIPEIRGKTLPYVPLVVIGSTNFDAAPDLVPLEGVADISVHIYMKSADIGQSEFMTANPTLVYTGVDPKDAPTIIGPTVALAFPNPQAKAYYVETSGSGIGAMQKSVDQLFKQAEGEAKALLGISSSANESSETVKLKQEASAATLKTVVDMAAKGIEKLLKMAADWMGLNPATVSFKANLEFSELSLSAQEITALLQCCLNNKLSDEAFFWNMQGAGLISEERTFQEEQDAIEQQKVQQLEFDGAKQQQQTDITQEAALEQQKVALDAQAKQKQTQANTKPAGK